MPIKAPSASCDVSRVATAGKYKLLQTKTTYAMKKVLVIQSLKKFVLVQLFRFLTPALDSTDSMVGSLVEKFSA